MDLDLEELEATRKKSADEMFEELGYEKIVENNIRIDYERGGQFWDKQIVFGLIDKFVTAELGTGESTIINMQELKAINKKIEELKWQKVGVDMEEDIEKLEKFANESILYGGTVAMTLEKYRDLQLATKKLLNEYKKYKEKALFICDPDKNKECKKTNCYINNGECMQTNNIKYAAGIDQRKRRR